jgi:hypothetical protein
MILRLRYIPTTQRFSCDPCPSIVVNKARSFSNGDVEIDFTVLAPETIDPWAPKPIEAVVVLEKKAKRSR